MHATAPGHLYLLPGKRIGVDRLRDWPRAAATTTWLAGPASLPLRWALRRGSFAAADAAQRQLARRALGALGIHLDVSGTEVIDRAGTYVIAPLHESLLDPALITQLGLPTVFAAHSEFLDWRIVGPPLRRSDHIIVDPGLPRTGYRNLLVAAARHVANNTSITIFPQGSILGIETAFHRSPFRLAERLEVPVLPVVITGSNRAWEHPFSARIRFGCAVHLQVLPPVAPAEAVAVARDLERRMKQLALLSSPAPRRYVPERDGWWDGYQFNIDPDFSDVSDEVASHRAARAASASPTG